VVIQLLDAGAQIDVASKGRRTPFALAKRSKRIAADAALMKRLSRGAKKTKALEKLEVLRRPIAKKEALDLEKRCGLLPASFRTFLLKEGIVTLRFSDRRAGLFSLEAMLVEREAFRSWMDTEQRAALAKKGFDVDRLLPIAGAGGNDESYVIDLRNGKTYHWDHEERATLRAAGRNVAALLARMKKLIASS
jgi:hypothetical protein